MQVDLIFGVAILIFSVILHEVAHGYMANYLGDPTARLAGRLTLNPLAHIDPVGSVLLPITFVVIGSPIMIGYAKPVPYNPYNLRGKYAEGLVAFAGPATNIILALIFGLLIRFAAPQLGPDLVGAFAIIVFINLMLALFNLIPVPPLDGSKILSSILGGVSRGLSRGYDAFRANFERMGILTGTLLLLLLMYLFAPYFYGVVVRLFVALTGVTG